MFACLKFQKLLLFCLPALLLTACGSSKQDTVSKSGFYFDTAITITLYGTNDETILDECFALCSRYEQMFSRTITDSEVSRINTAKGAPTTVSSETSALIKKAVSYGEISNGTFDISIAPISSLWTFDLEEPVLPNADDITSALDSVDYRRIHIEGETVTLEAENMSIDLGGIAKGYIADQLKEYFKSKNITSGLINLGGNVLAIGNKPDGSEWRIGIQKPFDDGGTPVATAAVSGKSLVTSGVYERYFRIDDTLYHHLLNPETGYPFDNNLYSVTILADSSADADALSTTCFGLGLEEGMVLIESLDEVEALFVTNDYALHPTAGFPLE